VNTQTAQMDDLRLIALPSAVNCADLFARFTLTEWALRPLLDEACEVAKELVISAVGNADAHAPGFLVVRLQLRGGNLLIEVEDQEFTTPTLTSALAGKESGVQQRNGRGNVLWCQLNLPTGLTASSVPLPRRERRRSPAAEALAGEPDELDPQFMERILFGLNRSRHAQPE
jgi:hypothetical protein